jgi:hypothetical protein
LLTGIGPRGAKIDERRTKPVAGNERASAMDGLRPKWTKAFDPQNDAPCPNSDSDLR